jgi:hypothetical protein
MGVGASKRFSAVRWGVAGPMCALMGGGLAELFLFLPG